AITASQRATERAMHRAEDVLSDAVVDGDVLVHEDEPLSAERLRAEIEVSLLYEGCHAEDVIVACGRRGSDPHWRGEGALRPDEPIVVDVFPRGPEGYYADMTRTFVVGEPPEAVAAAHRTTLEAMEAAFDVLDDGAGVTGETVHDAVCEVFEAAGHPTTRDDATEGFVHSTGHGVGLDLHEAPRLSESGGALPAGSVVTVEPGLYYSDWGGVRVEDLVVVRDDGFENLTEFDVDLVV
ncbi:MAG: M24 family metallopeptidase, partial [Halobacteriales archaeon]